MTVNDFKQYVKVNQNQEDGSTTRTPDRKKGMSQRNVVAKDNQQQIIRKQGKSS